MKLKGWNQREWNQWDGINRTESMGLNQREWNKGKKPKERNQGMKPKEWKQMDGVKGNQRHTGIGIQRGYAMIHSYILLFYLCPWDWMGFIIILALTKLLWCDCVDKRGWNHTIRTNKTIKS